MTHRQFAHSKESSNLSLAARSAIGALGVIMLVLPQFGSSKQPSETTPQSTHFTINAGINDAWFNPATPGQGFLMTVFPSKKTMFLAWFTFDTERPPENVAAIMGAPGHRWLTAQGRYEADTAFLTMYRTHGGVFDAAQPAATTDQDGYGTLTLEFADCNSALISYEIPSLGRSGQVPIQRVDTDNVPLCETLAVPEAAPEPEGLQGITSAHNKVRASVGVAPLVWDPNLAAIAQAWAEGCVDMEPPMGLIDHNPNRSDNYPGYVGENVFGAGSPRSPQVAVDTWAAEAEFYNYENNSCRAGKVCGHYKQVVWANTQRVGCGVAQCNDLTYSHTVVCNYSPGGNTGGRPY